jgi:hypothetical protein
LSTKLGVPDCTSSATQKRDGLAVAGPLSPSVTYMRVCVWPRPPGESRASANSVRSAVPPPAWAGLICTHVPVSPSWFERHTPLPYAEA